MTVKIIDTWINPGHPHKDNEDTWNSVQYGDLDLIWLLDGCTDVDRETPYPDGKTNAFWYKETLSHLLKTHPYISLQQDPKLYVASIIEKIRAEYINLGLDFDKKEWAYPSSTFVMAAYSKSTRVLRLLGQGDSYCLVKKDTQDVEKFPAQIFVTEENKELKKSLQKTTLSSFLVEDQLDFYRAERANSLRSGLRSLSLFPDRLMGFQSVDMILDTDTDLLLVSDGFYRLVDMHDMYSPLELFTEGSLNMLGNRLRNYEREKSAHLTATTSKIHDDATAVRVKIAPLS
jgi:hypothetical protein